MRFDIQFELDRFENGFATTEQGIELMKKLISTGAVWKMTEEYTAAAKGLIYKTKDWSEVKEMN